MKSQFLIAVLLFTVLCQDQDGHVLILHQNDFPQILNQHTNLMVKFYRRCGDCKKLYPVYKQLAKDVDKSGLPVKIAEVDVIYQPKLMILYNITKFPTLVLFSKGQHTVYEGTRDKQDMLEWLQQRLSTHQEL